MKHIYLLVFLLGTLAAVLFWSWGGVEQLYAEELPAEQGYGEGTDTGDSSREGEGHTGEANPLAMTAEDLQSRGIETMKVAKRILTEVMSVPGEVKANLYKSAQVTPRIPAQVISRHGRLGDKVEVGERLVTLSSVEMAKAQGDLIVANREWKRVRKLGKNVVSGRRYLEAEVTAQQARARVLAFGMTPGQIAALLRNADASKATGAFDLNAPQAGTIVNDNFVVGEVVDPGRTLFGISDETSIWVEAQVSPEQAFLVTVGGNAEIILDDLSVIEGSIIQVHHNLDERTRTLPVRIEADNMQDRLHPGQFVNVKIAVGQTTPALAVPESAVIMMGNEQIVFTFDGDEFHPRTIKSGPQQGAWVEVRSGLKEGDEVAVSEVFLLKSLILKSQMGED